MTQNNAPFLIRMAAFLGALAVIIGAFGAHGLKPYFSEYQLGIFEKGVQYHFFHTFALLAAGILQHLYPSNKMFTRAAYLFAAGIVAFSGSLYLLAAGDLLPFPVRWAGPVTPLGGLCFIAGWAAVFWGVRSADNR